MGFVRGEGATTNGPKHDEVERKNSHDSCSHYSTISTSFHSVDVVSSATWYVRAATVIRGNRMDSRPPPEVTGTESHS